VHEEPGRCGRPGSPVSLVGSRVLQLTPKGRDVIDSGARQAAFEPGAAPITLIDGEKLLDLLIQHGIGVRTKTIELLELDAVALEPIEDAE
jgi:restriction endonuclease Mrr